jgi:aryl-alcohol dehydrogenase-like predicted oxidoreductase
LIGKEKRNSSISQISLAWLLTDPSITSPIIGPRTVDQLKDNLGAVGLRLTSDEMSILNQASDWRTEKS